MLTPACLPACLRASCVLNLSTAAAVAAAAAAAAAHFWMGWILKCALISENTKHLRSCGAGSAAHARMQDRGWLHMPRRRNCAIADMNGQSWTPVNRTAPGLTATGKTLESAHLMLSVQHHMQFALHTSDDYKLGLLGNKLASLQKVSERKNQYFWNPCKPIPIACRAVANSDCCSATMLQWAVDNSMSSDNAHFL
jgi:hypothetical protein